MHPESVKDGPGQCDVCGMDLVPAEKLFDGADGSTESPLVIPASSALMTGRRAVVYVRLPDREKPTFEGREVVLGPRAGDYYVVLEGLSEGERVVVRGNFKSDSALQILARPSMMNPQHQGGTDSKTDGAEELEPLDSTEAFRKSIVPLFAQYFEL